MPLHPADRPISETLREDREAFIPADQLGFKEACMGEHVTDRFEPVPNSLTFIAWVAEATKNITLATGRANLGHHHPAALASEAAMVDSLVMAGTVDKIVDDILAFCEEVGDFGTLVYAGHDWVDPALGKPSMELMATEVMPRVNKAIG